MSETNRRILILGYGNVDRQDDGVAWHILVEVARLLDIPLESTPDEGVYPAGSSLDFSFGLQIVPEMAELIAGYTHICFIDAHTGNVPEEIHRETLRPEFQASPFTHHLTPASLLSFTSSLYNQNPEAVLISVRGYEFGFERSLSPKTAALLPEAARQILEWITVNKSDDEK